MGDNDVGNLLARNTVKLCLNMGLIIWSRVDYSDFTFAQYVSTGSVEGERARVPGGDTAKACSNRFNDTIGEVMVFEKRNFDHVGCDLAC